MRKRFLLTLVFGLSLITAVRGQSAAEHSHGAGPNGGVVFDLGSHHAELIVDHKKQQIAIQFLGADEKSPAPVAAQELILSTNATKTASGTPVGEMTITLEPADAKDGKASRFIGADPGIVNVADFSGVLTGEIDGKPAFGEFDEAALGHGHSPHDGVIAALKDGSGAQAGFVELKLHDDKGDLELWIAKDREIKTPMDIPLNTTIKVSFKDLPGKTATLQVRNNRNNEDEHRTPNLRDGNTNYFIFPGDSGSDAEWLKGKEFKSVVTVAFESDGKAYVSEEFVLFPHTHSDSAEHSHPHEEDHVHPHPHPHE